MLKRIVQMGVQRGVSITIIFPGHWRKQCSEVFYMDPQSVGVSSSLLAEVRVNKRTNQEMPPESVNPVQAASRIRPAGNTWPLSSIGQR